MLDPFLYTQTTTFIGRQEEIKDIIDLLNSQKSRLITLVGPGGIGKTRLAIEAASSTYDTFQDGVYFIDLNPVQTREQILLAIKEALDINMRPSMDPLQVLEQIQQRQLLLILDNFENVIEEAVLVAEILQAALKVKILATSREPLNLQEEWLIRIDGLLLPEKDSISLDEVQQYGAVQLFLERARQAGYTINDPSGLACAVRICRMVNGTPLAIELGASLLRSMNCDEIADQLQHNIDILSTSIRNIPSRHSSMRAVFEKSWTLMNEQEREGFLNLAVFNGWFQRKIAQEITSVKSHILSALVDKSLLQLTTDGSYRFHDLLTQYASEKMSQTPLKQIEIIHQFCRYYSKYVHSREADIKGGRQREALDEIEQEFNHIRSAWQRAAVNRDFEAIGEMIVGLNHFCFIRGYLFAYREMILLAIKHLAPMPDEEPHAVWGRILSRQDFSNYHEKETLNEVEISLQIASRENNTGDIARCLFALGRIKASHQDHEKALAYYQKSLEKYRELGDPFYLAFILSLIGRHLLNRGEFEAAAQYLEQSLTINQQISNIEGEAYCLDNLAAAQFNKGSFSKAKQNHLKANLLYTQLDHRPATAYSGVKVGVLSMFFGDFSEARTYLEKALALSREIKYQDLHSFALTSLGVLECLETENYDLGMKLFDENPAAATSHEHNFISTWGRSLASWGLQDMRTTQQALKESLALALDSNNLPLVLFCLPVAAAILAQRGEITTATEFMALSYEHPLSLNGWKGASPLISHFLAALKEKIPSNVFEKAWDNGRSKTIGEITSACTALTDALPQQQAALSATIPNSLPMASQQNLVELLSIRELEVLQLLVEGYSNRQIAKELVIALGTTKTHIHNIYRKLDVQSRAQAIHKARELTLLKGI